MDVVVTVVKRSFTDKDNKTVEYYDCVGNIGGQSVRFKIDPRDKSLFEFLYNQSKKAD
jgi:hypothetical protein